MIRRALQGIVCGAALAACGASPCDIGDGCSCSFDSDCPDPLVEFCDRRVLTCELRDEPLLPDVIASDAGQDAAADAREPELCDNGSDDDDDGLIDCDDPSCVLVCEPPELSVAFVESAGLPQVALVSLSGADSRVISGEGATQLATDPSFGPDGRLVVVFASEDFEGLHILNASGAFLRSVANDDGVTLLRRPTWTDSGTVLAAGTVDGARVILEMSLDGDATLERYRETDPERYVNSPTQLPDGSIVVTSGETAGGLGGGTGDLAYLEDGALQLATSGLGLSGRLMPDERGGLYAFSATASRVVYIEPREGVELGIADVEVVGAEGDASCAPINADTLVCSRGIEQPSGITVADLLIVDRAGNVLRRLTDTPAISEGGAAISPPLAGGTPAP